MPASTYVQKLEGDKSFKVKLSELRPLFGQPRSYIPQENIDKIAASFELVGQLTPIQVRELVDDMEYGYEMIEGETRYRAALKLKWKELDATLELVNNPDDHFEKSYVANFLRFDVIPLDKARGMERLRKKGRSVEEIRAIIGYKDVASVYMHLKILELPVLVLDLMEGEIPEKQRFGFSHAYELAIWQGDRNQKVKLAKDAVREKLRLAQFKALLRRAPLHTPKPSEKSGGGGGLLQQQQVAGLHTSGHKHGPVMHTRTESNEKEHTVLDSESQRHRYRSPANNWQSISAWLDDQELKIQRWAEMPKSGVIAMMSGREPKDVESLVRAASRNLEMFQSLVETLEEVQQGLIEESEETE